MATSKYFQQRARRADRGETLRILTKAGKGNPPVEGDELPADWQKGARRKSVRSYKGRDITKKNKPRTAIPSPAFSFVVKDFGFAFPCRLLPIACLTRTSTKPSDLLCWRDVQANILQAKQCPA